MSSDTTTPARTPALRFDGISKRFGATRALDDVTFDVAAGSVHALLGGNGSGKSTLIKILSGVYQADAGWIDVAGNRHAASRTTPTWSRSVNLHFVHQAVGTFPTLSVADNFALSSGYGHRSVAPVSTRQLNRRVAAVLERFELDVSPRTIMKELPSAVQMMVAVARALQDQNEDGSSVLVLDEPSAALPPDEVKLLLDAIRGYRRRGQTVVLVTHRLDEVTAVADEITFLRDGRHLETTSSAGVDESVMVKRIAGMEQVPQKRGGPAADAPARLAVQDLSVGVLEKVSLDVRRGEILGLSGLTGSGRSTLMLTLFGLARSTAGRIELDGDELAVRDPRAAVEQGIAYVPAERQRDAVFPDRPVRENLSLAELGRYWRRGTLSRRAEARDADSVIDTYGVVVASSEAPMSSMSGGNQQKVVIARWLQLAPRLLLLNEPTQGVDVGARAAIHRLIRSAAASGTAVIVASSDSKELAELCDRVVGMYQGRVTGEVSGAELTAERCMQLAYGRTNPGNATAGGRP